MHMDELAFEKQDMSACVNTMTTEVDLVIEQYVTPLLNTFGLAASIVLSSVYFLFLDWRMLAFLYAGSALTFAINRLCQPRLAKNQKQILRAKSDWIATLQGFYRNFSTIKDYGLEERESEALARSSDGSVQAHFRGGLELANLDSVDLDIGMAMFFWLVDFVRDAFFRHDIARPCDHGHSAEQLHRGSDHQFHDDLEPAQRVQAGAGTFPGDGNDSFCAGAFGHRRAGRND